MSRIVLERYVSGQLVDVDVSVTLQDETGSYGIKRNTTDAVVVVAGTATNHDDVGIYSYDTSELEPTSAYTAAWRIETTEWGAQYVYELIQPAQRGMCTLAELERETALRLGPYERRVVGDVSLNSAKAFVVPKLKTSLTLGGLEDMYVLRRGLLSDGSPVPGFVDDDRQRIIEGFTGEDGLIEVDRDYTVTPVTGEDIEIHYLDPEDQLRPIVLAALRDKCRIRDQASIRLRTVLALQNLSSYLPQIRELSQVYELSSTFTNSVFVPFLVNWWQPFLRDGDLWVRMSPVPYPNSLLVDHWRWASSLVNGAYSEDGPTEDADILHIPVAYGAAAAHERAFLYGAVRPRIMDAARTGLYVNQAMVVQEFEDAAKRAFKAGRRRVMVASPGLDARLLVNGPTLQQ